MPTSWRPRYATRTSCLCHEPKKLEGISIERGLVCCRGRAALSDRAAGSVGGSARVNGLDGAIDSSGAGHLCVIDSWLFDK